MPALRRAGTVAALAMDPVLFPLLAASDDTTRARVVEALVLDYAAPCARQMMRKWLQFNVNTDGYDPTHPDAADLYQEILIKIIQALAQLHQRRQIAQVGNFTQYAWRIATNACHDYLRQRTPMWSRLRLMVRDFLQRHPSFAIWRSDAGTLAGFAAWRGQAKSGLAERRLTEAATQPDLLQEVLAPAWALTTENLGQIIADTLNWAGGPVGLPTLVTVLTAVWQLEDYAPASLDDEDKGWAERLPATELDCVSQFEERETLARLWREIEQLPPLQRTAFCLSFADARGEDLFTLLLEARLVTFPVLAQSLGYRVEELQALWPRMPLERTELAAFLATTRPQVNKWRFRATEKLRRAFLEVAVRP